MTSMRMPWFLRAVGWWFRLNLAALGTEPASSHATACRT